ncbi:MAG: PQQ-binding-like beta-propeller repeat protein, partial [Armatimonadota bacterium]
VYTAGGPIDSSPALAGDLVFFGCDDGDIYALSAATGKQVWSFTAGAPITASPAISDGKMIIGSTDGAIYCFGR